MAFEKINAQIKLNKGTSRDEWGNFNYWGYKSPDGKVRARLYAPDQDGFALLSVRKFELAPNSWRRKITFDDAIEIADAFVKVSDSTKGFTSDEALRQINSLIEIHNDYYDEHVGRVIRAQGYNGEYSNEGHTVTGVSFKINSDDEVTVMLRGGGWYQAADTVIDYTEEFAKNTATSELDKLQEKLNASQSFIDTCRDAVNKGIKITEKPYGSYNDEGLLNWREANRIIEVVNSILPKPSSV